MASDPAAELEHLAAAIRRCQRCRLHEGRTRAVPGEGPPGAEWVLLGEGPGAAEDRTGRPFVGPAGRLLTELLTEAGLAREAVFITNCVKCRPPANRPPRRDELETCTGLWLHRQLDLIGPRLVVLLGQVATRQLLGDTATVGRCHGTLRQQDGRRYFVTYHPAAALRSPAVAAALRADFQILGGILAALRS
ncbi:uracil-DNA glycosylase [Candidatus Methylocalor cossyra]|uniref:Type-4 uracil-DNA glycosylase n=1 Tax=Candidatus Methylocalor cossyra TaxID=3108543 RepID=A0ABP1C6S4_9GAMM